MAIGILDVEQLAKSHVNPSGKPRDSMQPDQDNDTPSLPAPGGGHAINRVLSELNHEIRTALNGIVGSLDMLVDAGLQDAQRELADTAQHSAQRLLEVVEAAVDLAALQEGLLHLEPGDFELSSVLQAACGSALRASHCPAALLHGDAGRLRQAVSAMQRLSASHDGEPELRMSARRIDDACLVVIEAPFNGEKADRLTVLLSSPPVGTGVLQSHGRCGIDMELCRGLADLLGGSFSARVDGNRRVLRLEVSMPMRTKELAGKKLLVIESEDDDCALIAEVASRHGVRVETFSSASTATHALRGNQGGYDAAIIGRDEQGLDIEFLGAAIRSDPKARELRLGAMPDAGLGGSVQGFDVALTRPFTESTALAALVALLGVDSMEHPDTPAARNFTGRRILVADDNPVNLQVARRMLERLGCNVDVAADGREALSMHAAHPYELILMDCQMPVMDGREASARIRTLAGDAARVPVLAVTACVTQAERDCCLSSGMSDFIPKPLRPKTLDAALAKWLNMPPSRSESGESTCLDELDAVLEMFGDDFGELAKLYQKDSPPRIAAIHAAHAAGDSLALAKIAHAFGGSSASIGASGLAAICKELELQAKAGSIQDALPRMAAIEAEYERICDRLHSLLNP